MSTIHKILLVDDEADILEILSYNLEKEGFDVKAVSTGKDALLCLDDFRPNLILLDLMMPEMDGIEACEIIRSHSVYDDILIAFLTARSEDYSQIAGLNSGADDYIAKPIKPKVLVSKIKALLRRKPIGISVENPKENIIKVSNLSIDKEQHLVLQSGQAIELPRKEFELLLLLASKPGKVFSREEIFSNIWGSDVVVGGRTIDVHVRKIREKIGESHIKTIKGVGYKFVIK
ncbi:MAG: response regulator transcription factor [Flavobacteriales bacterium]